MTEPTAFVDLPADAYPVQIRAYRSDNDKLVWEAVLSEPPAALRVPPLSQMHGGVPIRIVCDYANGERTQSE